MGLAYCCDLIVHRITYGENVEVDGRNCEKDESQQDTLSDIFESNVKRSESEELKEFFYRNGDGEEKKQPSDELGGQAQIAHRLALWCVNNPDKF
jgi:hypothetical protein